MSGFDRERLRAVLGGKDTRPPDAEEERALLERVQRGDARAEEELVVRNIRLVYDVARRYQTPGATFDDLVQEGVIGLLKAARKFDLSRGLRFSTFAHWWIRQGISRFVKGPTRVIRLPEYVQDKIARTYRMKDELSLDLGRDPADHEIGHALGIEEGDVVDLFRLSKDAASLEAPLNDSEGIRVGNTVIDEARPSPEDEVDRQRAQQAMIDGLGALPQRQTKILAYRYGLADGTPRSRPWIGRKLGLSAERVRQLERSALKTLRGGLEAAA